MTPAPVVVVRNTKNVVGDDMMNNNFEAELKELKARFNNLSDLL